MDRSYEVYRYYLALKLHFTTDQYDVIKQQGRIRASKQAFYKRRDLLSIKKVAETYSDKEVVNFLVANFTTGDRWGGVFDTDARQKYLDWKRRIESLSYTFQKEIDSICLYCEKKGLPFEAGLTSAKGEHPYIIKQYLRQEVSIETLVILYKLDVGNFVSNLDKFLSEDIIWPDLSRIIKKYEPFLTIEKQKYAGLLKRSIGSYENSLTTT